MRAALSLLLAFALALLAPGAAAQERILSFDSDLRVQPDGSLLVAETIVVRAEGVMIRRGIYRDFPTRYEDPLGNRVEVDFELLDAERNGQPEAASVERIANGVRISLGTDEFLDVPAVHRYVIRYRTTRQLGFFEKHDELYWNVTGLGWGFAIDHAGATVTLPKPVPAAQLGAEAYTGAYGVRGQDYRAEVRDGGARFDATRALGNGLGLSVVLRFPKGVVPEPTRSQRAAWFFRDNAGVGIALVGLVMLVAFYWRRWNRHGRDPLPGPVFPQYAPPEGFSPGELRCLTRMVYDAPCYNADLVDLAVRGALTLNNPGGKEWHLQQVEGAPAPALATEAALLAPLFTGGARLELKQANHAVLRDSRLQHMLSIERRLRPKYFVRNGGTALGGLAFSVAYGALAFIVADGHGVPAILVLMGLSLVAHVLAGWAMMAPTAEGRKLLDRIEGLKLYLSIAERDELARLAGPGHKEPALDAGRYESLLPYAMALGVEDAWTGRFTAAVGAAAAAETARNLGWYHGTGAAGFSLGGVNQALSSSLSQTISSSASPPGSSSGSGGGGFSGGGGGGGGGGGR